MSRLVSWITCGASLVLVACAKPEPEAAPPDAAMMAMARPEGALSILARAGQVEQGQSDPRFDWVTTFEAQTGCHVTVHTAATPDEMLQLAASGSPRPSPPGDASWPPPGNAPHDIVIAPGDIAGALVRQGAVFTIDVTRIPSFDSIEPRLRQASGHFIDGKHYGVPFQWGPNVLLYDAAVFREPPDSWAVTFEERRLPDGRSNKGRVQALGRPIYIADAALYLKSKRAELGIQDPYELDEKQYAAALQLLRAQRPLVQRYWQDADTQVQDFRNEGVAASVSWPLQASTLLANKAKVATTIPAEGGTGWADVTMLISGARHPNCAYLWMEWSLSPKVQGDVAAFAGSNPVVPKACENHDLLGAQGCQDNGMDHMAKLAFWRTPEARCTSHPGGCVPYERWVRDFHELIGGSARPATGTTAP